MSKEFLKRYLNPKEAAAYLGIGLSTLGIHRMYGTGPLYISWATNVRYDITDLDLWMEERRVTPAPVTTNKRRVGQPRKDGSRPNAAQSFAKARSGAEARQGGLAQAGK